MSAELLRRAAEKLRDDRIPDGQWDHGPVDPRPNYELYVDVHLGVHLMPVMQLTWGREDPALPDLLASLLSARVALAEWLEWVASHWTNESEVRHYSTRAAMQEKTLAMARAILWEAS